jgi:hypothetical protein
MVCSARLAPAKSVEAAGEFLISTGRTFSLRVVVEIGLTRFSVWKFRQSMTNRVSASWIDRLLAAC